MGDNPEPVWDEYDWERFLQRQEKRADLYMQLMEKYRDHPQRDRMVAEEMGWSHRPLDDQDPWDEPNNASPATGETDGTDDDEDDEWDESGYPGDDDDWEDDDDDADAVEAASEYEPDFEDHFEDHPLYREAFELAVWIDHLLDDLPAAAGSPVAEDLASQAAVISSKIAAGLCGDDSEELGMSIAYMKRALHAANRVITAGEQLAALRIFDAARHEEVRARAFAVRDAVVGLIGDLRNEFRRRHPGR